MKNQCRATSLALVLLGLGTSSACGSCEEPSSDEESIRALIARAVQACQQHRLSEVIDLTTDDFFIPSRARNRKEVKRALLYAFRRLGRSRLLTPRADIELGPEPGLARATVYVLRLKTQMPDAATLADNPPEWLEQVADLGDLYRLELSLRKDDEQWLLSQAQAKRFRGLGF